MSSEMIARIGKPRRKDGANRMRASHSMLVCVPTLPAATFKKRRGVARRVERRIQSVLAKW